MAKPSYLPDAKLRYWDPDLDQVVMETPLVYPGGIVQQKVAKSPKARQTHSAVALTPITGLSITMTPYFSDSIIIIEAVINCSENYVMGFTVLKDGTSVVANGGNLNGSSTTRPVHTYYSTTSDNGYMTIVPLMWFEDAGSTDERTYSIAAGTSWAGSAYTNYFNDRSTVNMESYSIMTLKEVRP
jgi:hypothetical protein